MKTAINTLLLCLGWGALLPISAQCEGETWVVNTFSSMWITELSWTWVDGDGTEVHHYDWPGNLVTTSDSICVTQPCAVMELHSIDGTGWALGATVTVVAPDGTESSVTMDEGELAYHLIDGLNEGCEAWALPGCLDPNALNFTPGANEEDGSCDYENTFVWDDEPREYIFHAPPGGAAGKPLVFCMHGLSGNAFDMRLATQWNALADEHGFSVCYPQGTLWNWDGSLLPYWNAHLFLTPADDVGFLTALAQHLQSTEGCDEACTYATGASNGGMMSYALICERPDVWRGMATVGGVMSAYDQQNGHAEPARPVFHIHGNEDAAMPYDSYEGGQGPWTGGWGVMDMMSFWADAHGHDTVDSLQLEDAIEGDNLTETVFSWTGGTDTPVVHHRVNGGGHDWWGAYGEPSEVPTTELLWHFLEDICATASAVDTPDARPDAILFPNPVAAGQAIQVPDGQFAADALRWIHVSGAVEPAQASSRGHIQAPTTPGVYILFAARQGVPLGRVVVQ